MDFRNAFSAWARSRIGVNGEVLAWERRIAELEAEKEKLRENREYWRTTCQEAQFHRDGANRYVAELEASNAALSARVGELEAALTDANSLCRSAYQVANRIAVEHGTLTLQTNFGALADRLIESLKRQHAVLAANPKPQGSGE